MLGDCYFLAVLSSLAEFPERILALIETTKVNPNGRYELNFFVNGLLTSVEVDDYFPVKKGTKELAFAHSELPDMWVPLLEKGWAKLHGSYFATEGGIPSFAATHLTGVPTITWRHEEYPDHDDLWEMLKEVNRRNFTIMASSLGSGEVVKEGGVVQGHTYSIVSIYEFRHKGTYERLLKLRNPWGYTVWKGDWSDASEKWTPSLRESLGHNPGNNGVFFMNLEDYYRHFALTCVAAEQDDLKYHHSLIEHDFNQHPPL